MEKSESIKNIAQALITFHVKVDTIKKDANNPFFKSKYASLSNILESINTPLIESGLSFCQFPENGNGLTTILMHGESGEYIQCEYEMKPAKDDPQGRGSAITYQRRYAISSILGLNIDDDDDGNAASHAGNNQQQSTQASKSQQGKGDDKPWLNKADKAGNLTSTWEGAVAKLKAGTTTIEKIESVYKISKDNKAELLAIKKS